MNLSYNPQLLLTYTRTKGTTQNRKPTTKPRRAKRFKHVYCAAQDLGRTVGVEVTFIPSMFRNVEEAGHSMSEVACGLKKAFGLRAKDEATYGKRVIKAMGRVHNDPDCIEISTAKIKTRKMFRQVTQALHEVAGTLGMIGHNDWHGGGGAHIHVDAKAPIVKNSWGGTQKDFDKCPGAKALILDAINRPYICWAFSNPGDTENTRSTVAKAHDWHNAQQRTKPTREQLVSRLAEAAEWRETVQKGLVCTVERMRRKLAASSREDYTYAQQRTRLEGNYEVRCGLRNYREAMKAQHKARKALAAYVEPGPQKVDATKLYEYMVNHMGKHYGMTPRTDYGTIEFRMFQAPNDWREHELQLNFAWHSAQWI